MNAFSSEPPAGPRLTPSQIAAYDRDGIIKITLPPAVSRLRQQFLQETAEWLVGVGQPAIDIANLPAQLARLAGQDRPLIARLYKIARRFPAAKQLACAPFFVALAQELMRTALVSCCHFVNVRIDLPDEDRFLLDAHQDFPFIQGSLNGLTVWLPFTTTPLPMGPPSCILGSHRWGMLPVTEYGPAETGGSGGKSFRIADQPRLEAGLFVNWAVEADEALVFSTLLVHRSERNQSPLARLNAQLRFDDALAGESFDRNYPEGLYLGDRLATTYPEYIQRP